MVWLVAEEIQFEAEVGEVFKLKLWLPRLEVDWSFWYLWGLMVMAEVTETDFLEGVKEGEEERTEFDANEGIRAVLVSVSLERSFSQDLFFCLPTYLGQPSLSFPL